MDSVLDYAQIQRLLDAMDPRLCQNVEPQIREEDRRDKIVLLSERYDATMYKTRANKGRGGT